TRIVADDSIELGSNFVVGANKDGYHFNNANVPRDFKADTITDIAMAQAGYACPNCGASLQTRRGIEVGHVFKLGTRYSDIQEATYSDRDGESHPIMMGCYGIGVGRLLAASIEQHNDENGILFPKPIAPYDVQLVGLNMQNDEVTNAANTLYEELTAAGLSTLYDDRSETAGVKFNDADLLGLPVRVVVSPRNLKQGIVEIKERSSDDPTTVPSDEAVDVIRSLIDA
ncbi:MAG: proline--tRNA ligase, partial [Dehalococcoidia bacterium]|nr:proline--tRNA ligase [Dehalococcoidia bacterium]